MKKLIITVIVLAGLWFAYWGVGNWAIKSAINGVFAAQTEQGMTARNTGVSVAGFPNRFDIRVDGIELADPVAGWGWKSPFAQVYAMTWKPWHVLAALPSDQVVTLPGQTLTLQSDPIQAILRLNPNFDLGLNEIVVELQAAKLTSDAGWSVGIETAAASTRQDSDRPNSQRLGLKVTNVALDPGLMQKLADTGLPAAVAELYLDARVGFTAPIDRHVGQTHPQLAAIEISDAHVSWGEMSLSAKGKLAPAADGLAEGEIALQLKNWRVLPKALVALGILDPKYAPTVENALQALASQSPDLEVLDISLRCKQGWMYFGPLPLGPAPKLGQVSGT